MNYNFLSGFGSNFIVKTKLDAQTRADIAKIESLTVIEQARSRVKFFLHVIYACTLLFCV